MKAAFLARQPALLLQQLLQFDTSNPPGNESACILYLRDILEEAGIRTTLLARDPQRPNLLARLPGRGECTPLLLQGHVDVVPAVEQDWRYAPFAGQIVDGEVWGRGAVDMKGGIAMMVAACLRAQSQGDALPGDVVLALLADEETGGDYGAKYLVEEHASYFKDIRYAIGEIGGSPFYLAGKKFVSIPVQEKQACWLQVTLTGRGGHASAPCRDGVMIQLARFLRRAHKTRLPVHITAVPRLMLETLVETVPDQRSIFFQRLLDPEQTDAMLDHSDASSLDAILHNTINVTTIRAGESINVLPTEVVLQLDGRLLPGYEPADLCAELCQMAGEALRIEVLRYDRGPTEADLGLMSHLSEVLQQSDPGCIPLPALQAATSDARFFARLGIQTYGFLPTNIPAGYDLLQGVHAANERLPVASVEFGTQVLYDLLKHTRQ